MTPKAHVEVAATPHLLGVERDDQVALLQPAAIAGTVRHQTRDDHAFFDHMREDAEPGAAGPADDPAEPNHLLMVRSVEVARDCERAPGGLGEIQGHGPCYAGCHS